MQNLINELKRIFLFCIPFFVVAILYFIADPFMVLYKHTDYNVDWRIHKNLDFVSTEKYLTNSDSICYDSFIFGGSTALYVSPKSWKKYLSKENQVYAFIASGEHISGIWSKIVYLNAKGKPLKNALIILDTEASFDEFTNDNPLFMKHYEVYPSSKLNFHYLYFIQFINIRFLRAWVPYKLTNTFHDYMGGYLVTEKSYHEPITNEYHNVEILEELKKDSLGYYARRQDIFPTDRGDKANYRTPKLNDDYLKMCKEMKSIFEEQKTDYRIIVGPNYKYESLNALDMRGIKDIFGQDNVFDFTGVNKFTKDKSNFYDKVHFKKYVGNQLLEVVYAEK